MALHNRFGINQQQTGFPLPSAGIGPQQSAIQNQQAALGQPQGIVNQLPVQQMQQTAIGQPQGVVDAGFNPQTPKGGLPNQIQAPVSMANTGIAQGQAQVTNQLPQQQQPQQPQPQIGLSGFEGALGQGFNLAGQAINAGASNAVNTLGGNFGASASQVDPLTGQPLFQQASQGVNQFTGAGLQAQGLQSALSGAQGQQAFDAALLNNPLQNFLNQRGQQALANQSAASGGLGSGQFQTELQQLGQAQAGQQLQQQIQNLSALSGQGLQAAGQSGQFLSQAGQQQGQLAGMNAQLGTQANIASANNALNAASQQAGFQNQQGVNIGNLAQSTGTSIGGARLQTGRDLASQIGQSTSALSNLASQQGSGLADIIGAGGSNIANLLQNAGQLDAGQQTQLAQLLANLSTGQGSQLSNIALGQGNSAANLALQQGANQQQLIGNLAGAFGQFQGQQTGGG